jgi:hypothetical protein
MSRPLVVARTAAVTTHGTVAVGDLLPVDDPRARLVDTAALQLPDVAAGRLVALEAIATGHRSVVRGDLVDVDDPVVALAPDNFARWSPPPLDDRHLAPGATP